MKIISLALLASSALIATSAIAGDFSITSDPDSVHHLVVTCRDGAGKSGSSRITLQPGQQMVIGDPACNTYTVSISTANGTKSGRIVSYTLDANRSYSIFWNDRYWDIASDN
ncbi:TPA: hypothetical protein QDC20_005524 [Burkholderia aenigmatica]|uniref:hypothetical protein n=1 Tax=Burkholderia sp. AU45251 TaxID=3059204 RepID=UPI00264C222A|nr:hypothetical protein [Burkholderia sp. AU45251]HDR9481706.1 hypothetical protein [Burkholderia aenigmatica]MDN7513668.1 hypothetical protein [Burkholderia sp. AU45251]HDR9513233.1 hypothetical protein [Burkholderia aenigmatica]HDR9590077.1 hypothetical protein [Burkholderia aenigmatica]HDR9597918.1 hypothetical protein [Burkholderia aenigmatica]